MGFVQQQNACDSEKGEYIEIIDQISKRLEKILHVLNGAFFQRIFHPSALIRAVWRFEGKPLGTVENK